MALFVSFRQLTGALIHSPSSIVIEVAALPAMPAVLAHELCHARRYFLEQVPFFEFIPPRFFERGGKKASAAEHLPNMPEHIFILCEMANRLGFPRDETHIANDFKACSRDISNELLRKSIILTNWLLANFHFPDYVPRFRRVHRRIGNEKRP
jgi:hypothetical protein